MKTQLIQLDSHDDLISIRDKMTWAKTPRMLLVWPRKGRVDVRPLDLTLLRRHADMLGSQIGLVTRNGEIRSTARGLGIPVFSTTTKAQTSHWPEAIPVRPQRRAPRPDLRAMRQNHMPQDLAAGLALPARIGIFALGVLALLAVLLVFIPSAEISIQPPRQLQELVIPVRAEPGAAVNLSGSVPSREIALTLEQTVSLKATGRVSGPGQRSRGAIRLENLTDAAINVPAGTILLSQTTPAIRFETLLPVTIPAKKTAQVNIRSVDGGLAANLPANAVTAFESPLGLSLAATNPEPLTGGTDQIRLQPTDQDRTALRQQALAALRDQARTQLPEKLASGDVLLPSTLEMGDILEEVYTPQAGQPGDELTLRLRAVFRAFYVAEDDLRQLSALTLDTTLPAGYNPLPDSLQLMPASAIFSNADGAARWQLRATRQTQKTVDSYQVAMAVRGRNISSATSLLVQMLGLGEPPQIDIRPDGWPWLPLLPFRITIH